MWGWPDCNTLRNTHELKTESRFSGGDFQRGEWVNIYIFYSEEKLGGKIEEHGDKII